MKLRHASEEQMAQNVIAELQRQGWDVYQEVSTGYAGRRADIVGVRGPVTMVVECKTSLSLKLLDQLMAWRGNANYIVGAYGGGRIGSAVSSLCKATGAGLWFVGHDQIQEKIEPRFARRTWTGLTGSLRPEQKSAEYAKAGSRCGGYWTPFRSTCDYLLQVVKATPGIELKDALDKVKHHYASQRSAMSSLPGLIRGGHVHGIRINNGRPLKLYPSEHCGETEMLA